jgi:hypothetical protein
MKTLTPFLITVGIVLGTLVVVFRFAPVNLRKLITG